jgi:hypothetical protein
MKSRVKLKVNSEKKRNVGGVFTVVNFAFLFPDFYLS